MATAIRLDFLYLPAHVVTSGWLLSRVSRRWKLKMAHFLSGNEKCPDLIYDDDYRSSLVDRKMTPSDYRFARIPGQRARVRARTVLNRFSGFLKSVLEAGFAAKMPPVERKLEFRGGLRTSQK
jgi:hypothetical protein